MKQKFLKNSLLLFLIAIIIVSCELQEEAIHQHEHNSNLKLYEMKFEELMTNKRFVNSFSKLPKSKKNLTTATVGRTVMENEYGFTIANKPAKVIEDNGETSYTFLITRDSTDANSFENLVIQTDSTNTTKAVIIKYNLTSPITSSADDSFSFTYNREITPIVYNNETVNETSKQTIICYWVLTLCCNWGGSEHVAGLNCTNTAYTYNTYKEECVNIVDGSSGTSSHSGGSGGTGGANSINTSPVNNCITGNCIDPYEPTPCDKVKNQFINNTTLQEKLNTLSGLTSAGTENGFYKYSNSNTIQNAAVGTSGAVQFPNVPNSANCTIFAHTHNSPAASTYSIFSWDDLLAFAQLLKEGKLDANNFTAFLATADGTYYALTIENTQNFLQFFALGGDPLFDMNIAMKRSEQVYKYFGGLSSNTNPYIKENSTDNILDEKLFLDFIQDNNLGVSLLESNATFTTFDKVTHNKTTGNIDKIPCN
jgi:hypothetical protein